MPTAHSRFVPVLAALFVGHLTGCEPVDGDVGRDAGSPVDAAVPSERDGQIDAEPQPDGSTDPSTDGGIIGETSPGRTLPVAPAGNTFTNPVFAPAADPFIEDDGENYHLILSDFQKMYVRSAPTLEGLASAPNVEIWRGNQDGSPCCNLWAPEIWHLDGKWYVYYASDDGLDPIFFNRQRMYVLEADAPQGPYRFRGQITTPDDDWGIDGTIVEWEGTRYYVWSGHAPVGGFNDSHLYIAKMVNPWTLEGERVLISSPTEPWERRGLGFGVNEGPVALHRGDKLHLVFSASAAYFAEYCLAYLTLRPDGDPLDPTAWVKSPGCMFESNTAAKVYSVGHGCFVRSRDGREVWNVYHAKEVATPTWDRQVHMQQLGFSSDHHPIFGAPIPRNVPLAVPSSERARREAEYAVLSNATVGIEEGASSGQVVTLAEDGGVVRFEDALLSGRTSIAIRYRTGSEATPMRVRVGQARRDDLNLPAAPELTIVEIAIAGHEGRGDVELAFGVGPIAIDFIELL